MMHRLHFRIFAHSWVSDWNHGNAHFLRGLARELIRLGHEVRCYEPLGSWSLTSLVRNEGDAAIEAIDQFRRAYPELDIHFYKEDESFTEFAKHELRHADVVIVHEWNDPATANTILALKDQLHFAALFHDTHHRAYTNPAQILRFHLHKFDGVIAFGEAIRRIYTDGFGIPRAWTMHEAADVDVFHPISSTKLNDVVWIGNWGDEERTKEVEEFLITPAAALKGQLKIVAHGVRYPEDAVRRLKDAGIEYRGYIPNLKGPKVYGESKVTVHVPRRQYANGLSGIPTIRVFETLACGIPLLCSPWTDTENLFHPGQDYLVLPDGKAMAAELATLTRDADARRQLSSAGLETIRARHTCRHRAEQLLDICGDLSK